MGFFKSRPRPSRAILLGRKQASTISAGYYFKSTIIWSRAPLPPGRTLEMDQRVSARRSGARSRPLARTASGAAPTTQALTWIAHELFSFARMRVDFHKLAHANKPPAQKRFSSEIMTPEARAVRQRRRGSVESGGHLRIRPAHPSHIRSKGADHCSQMISPFPSSRPDTYLLSSMYPLEESIKMNEY